MASSVNVWIVYDSAYGVIAVCNKEKYAFEVATNSDHSPTRVVGPVQLNRVIDWDSVEEDGYGAAMPKRPGGKGWEV